MRKDIKNLRLGYRKKSTQPPVEELFNELRQDLSWDLLAVLADAMEEAGDPLHEIAHDLYKYRWTEDIISQLHERINWYSRQINQLRRRIETNEIILDDNFMDGNERDVVEGELESDTDLLEDLEKDDTYLKLKQFLTRLTGK